MHWKNDSELEDLIWEIIDDPLVILAYDEKADRMQHVDCLTRYNHWIVNDLTWFDHFRITLKLHYMDDPERF